LCSPNQHEADGVIERQNGESGDAPAGHRPASPHSYPWPDALPKWETLNRNSACEGKAPLRVKTGSALVEHKIGACARRTRRPNDASHPGAAAGDKLHSHRCDPVEQGFVSSLAHPGGNIIGFLFIDFQMKWVEMLKEAAPGVSRVAPMFNPDTVSSYYVYLRSFEAEPRSIAVEVAEAKSKRLSPNLDASRAAA
jgi:hypothetical protein